MKVDEEGDKNEGEGLFGPEDGNDPTEDGRILSMSKGTKIASNAFEYECGKGSAPNEILE